MRSDFDYTMLSLFQACKRKYYWRMIRDLVGRKPQTAPEFGKCIHLALDTWFASSDVKAAIKVFQDNFVENPEDDKRTMAVGTWILENYAQKYAREPFKVLHTEINFKLPLPNGNFHIGRIDKIIEWDGSIYVMDHKTTSQLGSSFFNKFKPNLQVSGYVWAARKLGYPTCNAMLIDAILVAKGLLNTAQRTKLTPLARDISSRGEEELMEFEEIACALHADIRACEESGVWTPNFDSCVDFGECPYRRICEQEKGIWERIVEMDYRKEVWDPSKGGKE